jgi:hypothetical protein
MMLPPLLTPPPHTRLYRLIFDYLKPSSLFLSRDAKMRLIAFICLYTITVSANCFVPDGTPRLQGIDYSYLPCNTSTEFSMCCAWNRTSDADQCLQNGLCYNPDGNYYWRESCTDPTWTSEFCSPLCRSGRKSIICQLCPSSNDLVGVN